LAGPVFPQDRLLEINYPTIGGISPSPRELPIYIKYIYNFAVWVIGLIIFGVIVYNGFLYMISAGNANKMAEAKSGILSGFLGALILLGAVIIFNTINPTLTLVNLQELPVVPSYVTPSLYVCESEGKLKDKLIELCNVQRRNEPNISCCSDAEECLDWYLWPEEENEKIVAGRLLNGLVLKGVCRPMFSSGRFREFPFRVTNNSTFFFVPEEQYKEGKRYYVIPWAAVLFEKETFFGRCALLAPDLTSNKWGGYISKDASTIDIKDYLIPDLTPSFSQISRFKSVSVFEFQEPEKIKEAETNLYSCLDYFEEGDYCPASGSTTEVLYKQVTLGENDYLYLMSSQDLWVAGNLSLSGNLRSLNTRPPNEVAILLLEDEAINTQNYFQKNCELVSQPDVRYIYNYQLSRHRGCDAEKAMENPSKYWEKCWPNIHALLIIKGRVKK
jgi:hypothetical protein